MKKKKKKKKKRGGGGGGGGRKAKDDIIYFREIRKIAVCFLWLSLPGDYRVTDEALLAETT